MSKYLVKGNYVGDGVRGLVEEGGSRRRAAATAGIESVGGSVESFYYAFGDTDVYGICDFPDEASATSFSPTVNASGAVKISLTPLLTAEARCCSGEDSDIQATGRLIGRPNGVMPERRSRWAVGRQGANPAWSAPPAGLPRLGRDWTRSGQWRSI